MTASTRSNPFVARRRACAACLVFAGALSGACGSERSPPPTNSSMGGSGGSGGSDVDAGSSGSSGAGGSSAGGTSGAGGGPGGQAGASGSAGAAGDGGVPPDGGVEVAFRCKPTRTFSASLGRVDSIPNDHFARLGAVSPDELTAAWTSPSGDIYVAERLSYKDPFGPPTKVNDDVALATERVALAPTGRTLIAVRRDRTAFVSFEKSSTTGQWATSNGLEFTQVRVAFEGDASASDPVLSGDKRSFFFVITPSSRPAIVYESVWDSVQRSWGLPASLPHPELQPTDTGKRRRPTGISSDSLTLFFLDESTNVERAAWRDAPEAPFNVFKDIGAFAEAVPSLRCDTLYHQGQDSAGPGVFMRE